MSGNIQGSASRKHPIERLDPSIDHVAEVWTLWYAAKHGKLGRVQTLLSKASLDVNSVDEEDGRSE